MNIGDKAPEILGKDEQGRDIRLSDYKGRKLVLYFYPKDNTSGCTAEAILLAFSLIAGYLIGYYDLPIFVPIIGLIICYFAAKTPAK